MRLEEIAEVAVVDWLNANSGFVTAVATAFIAVSAGITVWLTKNLARDNSALLKAGTEPEVVAYLDIDARSGSLVNLVFENVGRGPACDLEYFVIADPKDFAAHEVRNVMVRRQRKIARLLPQGGRIERMLGMGFELIKEDRTLRPFSIKVSYSNLREVHCGPHVYNLDVSELGDALARKSPEERTADSLTNIEKYIGRYVGELECRRVETSTAAERQASDKVLLGQRNKDPADGE
jgi:hypothetical protein